MGGANEGLGGNVKRTLTLLTKMDDKSKAWRTSAESREGKAKNIIEDVSSLPLRFFLSCIASINEYRRLRHKFPFTLCHALTGFNDSSTSGCSEANGTPLKGLQVYSAFCHFALSKRNRLFPPLPKLTVP